MSEEPLHPKMKPRKSSARQPTPRNHVRVGLFQRGPKRKIEQNPYEVNVVTASIIHSVEDAWLGVRHYFGMHDPKHNGLTVRKPLLRIYTAKKEE
jgi:hypothetical protein